MLDPDGVASLSRLVSNNSELVTEPGLVKALYEGNATAPQADAINQFLGGLKAEQAVRAAAAAGTKINLSQTQQTLLDSMGIDYKPVLHVVQPPKVALQQQMASQGVQPVTDPQGNVVTDKHGNPHVAPSDAANFFGINIPGMTEKQFEQHAADSQNLGDQIGNAITSAYHTVTTGNMPDGAGQYTASDAASDIYKGYNVV